MDWSLYDRDLRQEGVKPLNRAVTLYFIGC